MKCAILTSRRFFIALVQAAFVLISGGDLFAQGQVVAWGSNVDGSCNIPSILPEFIAIAAGDHSLAIRGDGSIVGWERNDHGQCNPPNPNSGFIAVGAGTLHSIALGSDGSLVAWGDNTFNQCTITFPNEDFVAISTFDSHNLGLRSDGSIVAWGRNDSGQCYVPAPNSNFVAVAAGGGHSLGLKSDGSIAAWGSNFNGNCNVPPPNTDFIAIAAGYVHSMGLKEDGSIVVWGNCERGECNIPEPNTGYVSISAGRHVCVALRRDKTLVGWGAQWFDISDIPEPNAGFAQIACGQDHALALRGTPVHLDMVDRPGDQGGYLRANWNGHWSDSQFVNPGALNYDIQRLGTVWATVLSLSATESDSYAVELPTPDVFTLGEPEPWGDWRVVTRTSNPSVHYESEPVRVYSIDDIPPPTPEVQLLEFDAVALIMWEMPDIPDFNEACIYRGTTPDFVPDEPFACSETPGVVDQISVVFYYRVQFSDIHGNLSEFSEVLSPTTTAVGDDVPASFALLPPYPNPFNPRTTLGFMLPAAGHTVVAIYDARGTEVARLVDESLPAGAHTVDWDGRDDYGASMPSGMYFCRLTSPWGTETKKTQLVR